MDEEMSTGRDGVVVFKSWFDHISGLNVVVLLHLFLSMDTGMMRECDERMCGKNIERIANAVHCHS